MSTPTPSSAGDCKVSFPFANLSFENQCKRLDAEFLELQRQENRGTINFSISLQNRRKNRYLDILANDATIHPPPVEAETAPSSLSAKSSAVGKPIYYINGNMIDLDLPHKFVACQAPTPLCIPDFLSFLHDSRVHLVVMTTRLREEGFVKADRYWPEGKESPVTIPNTGGLVLSTVEEKPYETDTRLHIIRRTLKLCRPGGEPHIFTQIQFCGWPDRGIPQSSEALEALLLIVTASPTSSPVVVHCSAGIGRTGTLIGAYAAVAHWERGTLKDKSVYEIVSAMKRARFGMVQRVEQYAVIYLTVMSRMRVNVKKLSDFINQRATETNASTSTTTATATAAVAAKTAL